MTRRPPSTVAMLRKAIARLPASTVVRVVVGRDVVAHLKGTEITTDLAGNAVLVLHGYAIDPNYDPDLSGAAQPQ